MEIALLQTDIVWGDADANIRRVAALMDRHPGVRLYVLPEMWATGFNTQPDAHTLEEGHRALTWMEAEARRRGVYIAGSLPIAAETDAAETDAPQADADAPQAVNRLVVAGPEGLCATYDKVHLFTYGGEPAHYRPGHSRTVVTIDGVRFMWQICYDLRFPVFARNRGDYDVLVYVANWPASRRRAWDTLVRARAIENQCYVCAVNRTGNDPLCAYDGGTVVVDAYGRDVAAVARPGDGAPEPEAVVSARIDMERLTAFRSKFAVLADADAFTMG